MAPSAKPVPAGYHTVTPTLTIRGVDKALDFYKFAFGAEERMRFLGPDEKSIMHAELGIGNSIIMLNEEYPGMGCRGPQGLGGTSVGLYLYVEDVDHLFNRAVSAGAKVDMPITNMFWGDRCGQVADPFGHKWTLATHKEDLSPQEMRKRADVFFAQMALETR